jgi:hypothetical protein
MISQELQRLINNFSDEQIEILAGIAVKMATIQTERFTGQMTFILNVHQGGLGDMHINKGEIFRPQKKRRIRSEGI